MLTVNKTETMENDKRFPNFKGTNIKITTDDKEFLDEIPAFLRTGFECYPRSPKMHSEDQGKFFQYISIEVVSYPQRCIFLPIFGCIIESLGQLPPFQPFLNNNFLNRGHC
jgi:tRNA splicing ligase